MYIKRSINCHLQLRALSLHSISKLSLFETDTPLPKTQIKHIPKQTSLPGNRTPFFGHFYPWPAFPGPNTPWYRTIPLTGGVLYMLDPCRSFYYDRLRKVVNFRASNLDIQYPGIQYPRYNCINVINNDYGNYWAMLMFSCCLSNLND